MKKRGLSMIVTSLIMILLALVAIGIIWFVVNNVLKTGTDQIDLGKLTFDANIESVKVDRSLNGVNLKVTRNAGEGEISGIKFVFESATGSEIITKNVSLEELESETFDFHLDMDVDDLVGISIAPMIISSSGKESTGNVVKERVISRGDFEIIKDDLVLYLPLDEDMSDKSGNGNDGIWVGTEQYVTGHVGQAADFSGDDYINLDGIISKLSDSTEGTISLWVKFGVDDEQIHNVIDFDDDISSETKLRIQADFRSSYDRLQSQITIGNTHQWVFVTNVDSLDSNIGEWLLITLVQNGTEAKFYFNGVEESTTFTEGSYKTKWFKDIIDATSNVASIGARRDGAGVQNNLIGLVDDVRIYNKVLTPEEITSLYEWDGN